MDPIPRNTISTLDKALDSSPSYWNFQNVNKYTASNNKTTSLLVALYHY